MGELIVVGDRVLVKPKEGDQLTEAGLVLPSSVAEKKEVRAGQVVRTGPGYLMPNPEYTEGESWKQSSEVRYLPLQAKAGDMAFFLKEKAIELQYEQEDYLIVPHRAILALVRPDAEDHLESIDFNPGDIT